MYEALFALVCLYFVKAIHLHSILIQKLIGMCWNNLVCQGSLFVLLHHNF